MGILDYSTTPSSNTSINGIGIQGTNNVQNFDNAFRQLMADISSGITRRASKAANYTAVKADNRQLIEFTAAATLSLTAAATLTDGWSCIVKANGGNVTIDPNGSEEIDGETTLVLWDGTSAFIFCTGSAFHSIVMSGTDFGGNGLTNVGSLNGGPLAGFRNKIINGDFDVWQRGNSLVSDVGTRYLADRWGNAGIGSSISASQGVFPPGYPLVAGEPKHYHSCAVSSVSGAGNYALTFQDIESVRTLAGKTATLTFYARSPDAASMAFDLEQLFGTGGSPSSPVAAIGAQKISLTTDFQKFTFTIAVPSVTGKTLGSDGNDKLRVNFWYDAGSNWNSRTGSLGHQSGTFDLAHISLVEGDATAEADPFSPRHIQQEDLLCRRYYRRDLISLGGNAYTTGGIIASALSFGVPMRATPTISKGAVGSNNVAGIEVVDASQYGMKVYAYTSAAEVNAFVVDQEVFSDAEI